MILTRGTLLREFPGVRFAVVRIRGEWRARAVRPHGLGTVEAKSANAFDAIRRAIRDFEPERSLMKTVSILDQFSQDAIEATRHAQRRQSKGRA